jgi:hypothetical protein
VIIQGNGYLVAAVAGRRFSAVMLLAVSVGLLGCSSAPMPEPGPDWSKPPPGQLLDVFLDNESARGAVKFIFTGGLQLENGESHRFRGACGYTNCAGLRVQLLGPLGVTLLDYVNAEGRAALVNNRLTPEGDEDAVQGLMELMEIFTLALVDRCRSSQDADGAMHNLGSASFVAPGRKDSEIRFTLDPGKAVLLQQHIRGGSLPESVIDYSDYRWSDGYWSPGRIAIQSPGMQVSISLEIVRWTTSADLPDNFFQAP